MQVDIIPVPMNDGETLNCEDVVVFADEDLRRTLSENYPQTYARCMARRKFLADEIGLKLNPEILPFSSAPLCLAPFWSTPEKLLTRS